MEKKLLRHFDDVILMMSNVDFFKLYRVIINFLRP